MIILLTFMITVFSRRRIFWLSLVSFAWLMLGFANFILLSNRVTPFNATDILLMKPAIAVIQKYYSSLAIAGVVAFFVVVLLFIVSLWFKAPKLRYKIKYIRNACITAVVVFMTLGTVNLGINTGVLAKNFDNLANAYKSYGFAYCFANSVFNMGVSKPENYSPEKISEIIQNEVTQSETEADTNVPIKTPNIIYVQLESFFDINRISSLVLSENPIPNFTKLKEECSSGFFNVPVIGAGTANTEFEVLTGMNLDDFGPGEYPYKTVLQSTTCESVAYNLKANGWSTHAIHNNDGTFYQRHTVFSQLGFDTFTPIEYMHVTDFTPKNWATDKILTGEILKCLDSSPGQDYVFTVSVEGHGSYPNDQLPENSAVSVLSCSDPGKLNATQYYVNLLHSMDQTIGEMVSAVSSRDEDTILVFYGDHLPSLGYSDSDLSSGTSMQTDYIIWNNMGMNFDFGDVEAFQLSSKILDSLNISTGVINNYHQTYSGSEEYLNGLQNLEYDILYGGRTAYGGLNPYVATNIQYGIDKISITGLLTEEGRDDTLIITGENFTDSSVAYVNDKKQKTEYIDPNHLRVYYSNLQYQDIFKVSQQGSDGVPLGFTEEYVYNQ
ncbi:LTA synthase family protein [Parasporobacterium paucivorans]|nr:alkaline phosphatase family protein [Parasporobacterium paucivorans]